MPRVTGRIGTAVVSACVVVVTVLGVGAAAEGSTHGRTSIVLATRNSPTMGAYLVSSRGFTLYTFTLDRAGKSACSGACAKLWPPLLVPKGVTLSRIVKGLPASRLGTIKRSNGTRQLTYEGTPLYRFTGDKHPGQTAGQGLDNIWFVALVRPGTITAAPTPSPTTTAAPPPPAAASPSPAANGSSGTTPPATPPTTPPAPPTTEPAPPPPTTQPPAPPTTLPPVGGGGGYGY